MMNIDFARARNIFLEATEKLDNNEANAFLDVACGNDAILRQHVNQLLEAHQMTGGFLEQGAILESQSLQPTIIEVLGTNIGPYKLLEQIGEGGMGTVYVAEQKEPVRRKVALKLIKPGMDSHQVVARFEAERQALAMMNHPNIAKVLDVGTTTAGRPYFAMELVKGTPITEFCDQHKLDTRERLQLCITVCQAVQHAHQKGLIHRDLKPSNVLVEIHDVKPVPKVIDFGVAKAIGQQLTDKTLHTGISQMIGTPLYMSPEQAGLSSIDIDTRSDIYSLGVLLYEILTGHTPFENETLRKAGFDEMRRLICEVDPPRPSTRISTLEAQALSTVSDCRKAEPRKLSQQLRGELDWIVMKALEKDRNRRYESASALAADIQRYLNDEPVQACPPSAAYRLGKFARRHKAPITTATLVALALVVGTVVSVWQAVRATQAIQLSGQRLTAQQLAERQARDEAQLAEAEATRANSETERAKTATAIAQAINDFINKDVFEQADPHRGPDRDLRVKTVLDRAAGKIGGRFENQPLVEASIRATLGEAYFSLGEYRVAEPHLSRAHELRLAELSEENQQTNESLRQLAALHRALGRIKRAVPMLVQALDISRRLLGDEHLDSLEVMNQLAMLYRSQGHIEQAERLAVGALEIARKIYGENELKTLIYLNNLATVYAVQSRALDAQRLLEEAVDLLRRAFGREHPDTLIAMKNLASTLGLQGRFKEKESQLQEIVDAMRRVLGEEHPDALEALTSLAQAFKDQGRYADATALQEQVLEVRRRVLGEDHPQTLHSMNYVVVCYMDERRFADAETLAKKALDFRQKSSGDDDDPDTLCAYNNVGFACLRQNRPVDALPFLEKAVAGERRLIGDDNQQTLLSSDNLARVYGDLGRNAEAEALYSDTLAKKRRILGEDHPLTITTINNLGMFYAKLGHFGDGIPLLEEALDRTRRLLGADHPETLTSILNIAGAYERNQEFSKAEPFFREVLAGRLARLGLAHVQTAGALASLGQNLLYQHKFTEAEPLLIDAVSISQKTQPDAWNTFSRQSLLGGVLLGLAHELKATDPDAAAAKLAEAEPLLIAGYEGLKVREAKIPPANKLRLHETIQRLIELYTTLEKPDAAAKWQKELDSRTAEQPK